MANSSVTLAQIRAGTAYFENDGSTTAYGPVKAVQQALYLYGYHPGGPPDSKFGSGTDAAIKGFQNQKGLSINGLMDKTTLASLEGWAGTITDDTSVTPTLDQVRNGLRYFASGHSGAAVNTIRTLLIGKGYSCTSTGSYDSSLVSVIKQFQTAVGLSSDGFAGQGTLAVLEDASTSWLTGTTVSLSAGRLARAGFKNIMLRRDIVTLLNNMFNEYSINTKQKVRFFLAQCAEETGWGGQLTETGYTPGTTGTKPYAPFYGAGFLQLTWNTTYKSYDIFKTKMADNGVNDNKITTPELYATQHVAIVYPGHSAGCVWTGINSIGKDFNSSIAWSTATDQFISDSLTTGIKGSGASAADKSTRKAHYDAIAKILT